MCTYMYYVSIEAIVTYVWSMNNLVLRYLYVIVIAASPKSVGWEKNAKNKLTSRKVDLSSSMDPVRCVQCFVTIKRHYAQPHV